MSTTPFHLAFPVRDLEETRAFYRDVLGANIGRSSELDFGHFERVFAQAWIQKSGSAAI
ncbi:hypothetical protein LCGC14_0433090 [marine sediment metagenome]|uniref:Glyoxalase/fosfomycin resistance/dioxygenase domain-containing protein n=1 Tax=marine sediment metagenome TaxID=412755 RepID=A0A0F9SMF0_9ZZZZ